MGVLADFAVLLLLLLLLLVVVVVVVVVGVGAFRSFVTAVAAGFCVGSTT